MPPHQGPDPTGSLPIGVQAAEDFFCDALGGGGVALEVPPAAAVREEAGGLADVVEQHGQPQHRLRRDPLHRPDRVLVHVPEVVRRALVKAPQGLQLRDDHREDLRKFPEHPPGPRPAEELQKLRKNPLGSHQPEPFPENPQRVLPEPPVRVPHAADDPRRQVLPAPEAVGDSLLRGPGHGVDGEIPPGQVLPEGTGEGHGVRPAAVGVGPVHPVGGDLQRAAAQEDRHRAVLFPGGDHRDPGKDLPDLLGKGGGGDVPVVGLPPQQAVPDAAPHGLGGVPGVPEPGQGLPDRSGAGFRPDHWAMAAVWPRVSFNRSSGESSTWVPIFPPLTIMVAQDRALSSRVVRKAFFIPMGEQPPRI